MLNNIESKNHRVNEARRQPIILWRDECEQVDILLLFTLCCWIGADDGAACGGDRNSKEGGHGGSNCVEDQNELPEEEMLSRTRDLARLLKIRPFGSSNYNQNVRGITC